MSQTRTQKYAGIAMQRVKAAAAKPPEVRKEYKSRADSIPTMVLQSGLTQALGFLRGKGDVYLAYADDIAKVLGMPDAKSLHEDAIKADLPTYRRLTREVLEASALIKRFGQIELKDSNGKGSHSASKE